MFSFLTLKDGEEGMAKKRYKPEEIISKLR